MDYQALFKKFISLLSLTEERIELNVLSQNGINEFEGSDIHWDEKKKTWIINFVDQHTFFLAHELGHLFLYKKYNNIHFARQTVPVNVRIGEYNVSIVDSFVNYYITKFKDIYDLFVDIVDIYLNAGTQRLNSDELDILMFYINLYLDFQNCLSQDDFNKREKKIKRFFSELENIILKQRVISKAKFELVKAKLEEFEGYLEVENDTTIINFIVKLLKRLPFWNSSEVNKNIRRIYNIKKKDSG